MSIPRLETSPDSATAASPRSALRFLSMELIAQGCEGHLFRGFDDQLKREVALKVVAPENRQSAQALRRFHHEAEINARLQHPGIVPVYEIGESSDYGPYFAMRLVSGRTLREWLRQRGERQEIEVGGGQDLMKFLDKFEKVAQTLAYAHANGVIHCDLKPENVLIGEFGEVQVLDWSSAKLFRGEGGFDPWGTDALINSLELHSKAAPVSGTPGYISPEQARGESDRLDPRTDVFSLGAILCEILLGRPPFVGARDEALKQARLGQVEEVFRLLEQCPADPQLVLLAKSCLQPRPADRIADAAAVAKTVASYRRTVQEQLREAELARAIAQAKEREERRRRRLTMMLAVVVFATIALGGVAAGLYFRDLQSRLALVQNASREAEEAADSAGSDPDCDFRLWLRAQDAAKRALSQVKKSRIGGSSASRMQLMLREIEESIEFLHALETLRLPKSPRDSSSAEALSWAGDQDRLAFFRRFGMDLEKDAPSAISKRLADLRLRRGVILALDEWAFLTADARLRARLLTIARDADDDRAIQSWRTAAIAGNPAQLKAFALELATEFEEREVAPPVTRALFLGAALTSLGERELARETLKAGFRRHPNALWLSLALVREFSQEPRQPDEVLRAFTAAVAIRPEFAALQLAYGHLLRSQDRFGEANEAFREAIRLEPRNAEFWLDLASFALSRDQDRDAAEAFSQGAAFARSDGELKRVAQLQPSAARAAIQGGPQELWAKALQWLRPELEAIDALGSGEESAKRLRALKNDPKLAKSRDLNHIKNLGPADRALWLEFWADIDRRLGEPSL